MKSLEKELELQQPKERAGFRSNYSKVDHLQTLQELQERYNKYELPLCMAFVDYEKAFDSVNTEVVLAVLREQEIEENYLDLLKKLKKHRSSD